MNLHELVSELIINTKGSVSGGLFSLPTADSSLGVFIPELCLCATIVLLLFIRLFNGGQKVDLFWVMLAGSGVALVASSSVACILWPNFNRPSMLDPCCAVFAKARK